MKLISFIYMFHLPMRDFIHFLKSSLSHIMDTLLLHSLLRGRVTRHQKKPTKGAKRAQLHCFFVGVVVIWDHEGFSDLVTHWEGRWVISPFSTPLEVVYWVVCRCRISMVGSLWLWRGILANWDSWTWTGHHQ